MSIRKYFAMGAKRKAESGLDVVIIVVLVIVVFGLFGWLGLHL
jgi:hypothetical protein